jgi:hypothetical protein
MSDPNPDLDAFRAEARSWLGDHFPATLAGRGSELMGGVLTLFHGRFD